MTTLKWETPANFIDRTSKWPAVLAELQAHPGEWAIVYESPDGEDDNRARNRKNSLRSVAVTRSVRVETATRKVGGVVKVYARVVESE